MDLKFRAWDKKTKEYFHISDLWNSGTNPECFNFNGWTDNFGNKGRLKDIAIEQYTGLKDVNDEEVYEGDIVHGYDPEPDRDDDYIFSSVIEVVNFKWGSFWLGDFKNQIMLYTPPIIEVIGNVHTNPELLEDKR